MNIQAVFSVNVVMSEIWMQFGNKINIDNTVGVEQKEKQKKQWGYILSKDFYLTCQPWDIYVFVNVCIFK